jgi:hypothetical protein
MLGTADRFGYYQICCDTVVYSHSVELWGGFRHEGFAFRAGGHGTQGGMQEGNKVNASDQNPRMKITLRAGSGSLRRCDKLYRRLGALKVPGVAILVRAFGL